MDKYQEFLSSKTFIRSDVGIDVPLSKISKKLFPWQRLISRWALRKGRAALFEDCGAGKSAQMSQWAKNIPGRTISFCPLAVAPQLVREFKKFGVDAVYSRFPTEEKITITNYELMHRFNPNDYEAVILDESSILKSFEGKFRNEIIARYRHTPYRLEASATPAPNDWMELGNHSEFLGNLTRTEMLATFFVHDGGDTSKWRLKGHAVKDFWKWVASFAVMLRKPSDIGFSDDGFILPELRIHEIVTDADSPTPEQLFELGSLFPVPARTLMERRQARSATIEDRAKMVADIVATKPDEQWIVWTNLNKESELVTKLIPGAVEVTGSDTPEFKEQSALDFADGKLRVLVSKSLIFGYGMNFQSCHNEAFLGLSDSWEQWYQAVRRVWRFGQKHPVDCYIVTSSLEGEVVKNIKRKEKDAQRMAEEMVKNMSDLNKAEIKGRGRHGDEYKTDMAVGSTWESYLGDSVEIIPKEWPDESVGYYIYSPPFASLYTYSASERDMGNCRTHEEFYGHLRFLAPELFRTLKAGRLMSFHCMNLPTSKERDGVIGITDFRGKLIQLFSECQNKECTADEATKKQGKCGHGFIFHSEVCIWKDPVTAMQRTKALGLLHKQVKKDSCMSRQGIPDYLVTMRKPGENQERVEGRFEEYIGEEGTGPGNIDDPERKSIEIWQRYASPVWMDIDASDTLQKASAREDADERHICPMQLQVIERGIELWSNPGDVVADPYAGIGSTGFKAVKMGRRFKGCELKESYWKQNVANLKAAEITQENLFSATEPVEFGKEILESPTLDEAV